MDNLPAQQGYGNGGESQVEGRRAARLGLGGMLRMYPLEWQDADDRRVGGDDISYSLVGSNKDSGDDQGGFVNGARSPKDAVWVWLLAACTCVTVVLAVAVPFYRNPNYEHLVSKDSLYSAASCPRPDPLPDSATELPGSLPSAGTSQQPSSKFWTLLFTAATQLPATYPGLPSLWRLLLWGVLTLAATAAIGTALLRLSEANPHGTVKAVRNVQIGAPVVLAVVLLVSGNGLSVVPLLILAGVNAICSSIWEAKLSLMGRLVSTASAAIADNPTLFWVSLVTQGCVLCLYIVSHYITAVANTIGSLQPIPLTVPTEDGTCTFFLADVPTPCCAWQTASWASALPVPMLLITGWATYVAWEIQTFIVAGTVCQWYFAPVSAAGSFHGNVARSARHARSSLGTLVLGALMLRWVKLIRTFTYVNDRRLRLQDAMTWLCGCLTIPYCCVCWCISPCLEHITKYATHWAAISGHGFFHSSGVMFNTLRRNRLNAIGMGWLPPFILRFSAVTLALAISWTVSALTPSTSSTSGSYSMHDITCLTVFTVLTLPGLLLLTVIDSLYICFALDRDQQQCSSNEVHDILTSVPAVGPLWDPVPDGGVIPTAQPATGDGMVVGVPAAMHEPGSSSQQQYAAPPAQNPPRKAAV